MPPGAGACVPEIAVEVCVSRAGLCARDTRFRPPPRPPARTGSRATICIAEPGCSSSGCTSVRQPSLIASPQPVAQVRQDRCGHAPDAPRRHHLRADGSPARGAREANWMSRAPGCRAPTVRQRRRTSATSPGSAGAEAGRDPGDRRQHAVAGDRRQRISHPSGSTSVTASRFPRPLRAMPLRAAHRRVRRDRRGTHLSA